ncbi:MAG: phosphatidylserine/phosphatidylglycerophosphate/cardiolipin synthase family protein [Planctomycetaceae bacterium]|nr:phosphatidylserine/phosphatidylglycerophosphate/cardiolipin synthase family protein [Planctomycetaceae bacterium]
MRGRRLGGIRALALGFAVATPAGPARAEGHDRVVPENAAQPPGASFEGQPSVGRAQKIRIAREALAASARSTACAPIRSTAQVSGRLVERLAVRAVEVASLHGGCPTHCHGASACDLGGGSGGPQVPARLTLLPSSEASIRALLDLIASASCRIDLMMYGWEDDPTGREVAAALAEAARRGVRVRLMADRTGVLIHNPAAAEGRWIFLDELRTVPNVTLIEPPGPFFRFDHRKLAVVDGRVAWSGSMILTEVARRRWRNVNFLAEGPIVPQSVALFEDRWREVGGPPEGPLPPAPAAVPPMSPNAQVRMVRTDIHERSLKDTIYHAVDHARRHIYLENPYFSDDILTDKLIAARERGVDVRAILTLRGNVRRLNRYETLTANRLLRGGVRVFLYPAMTHVKAMSADGVWAYVGTGNFDELSLRNNREVSLSISSPDVVGELDRTVFLPDMAVSQELWALMPAPKNWLLLELMELWY